MPSLMRTICALSCLLLAAPLTTGSPVDADLTPPPVKKRAIYAIAHSVMDKRGFEAAIRHGANAIEIDTTAYKEGWWADHDLGEKTWGDSVEKLLNEIAVWHTQIAFVWFDIKVPDVCREKKCSKLIKDPNSCKANENCSVQALQRLAQRILRPRGIEILYGFYGPGSIEGSAFKYMQANLKDGEAIDVYGESKDVLNIFKTRGKNVDSKKRVMNYGFPELSTYFGNCNEKGWWICAELKNGAWARDHHHDGLTEGKLGRVFGWTSQSGEGKLVKKLLDKAQVDGIIYGHAVKRYDWSEKFESAARDILDYVYGSDHLRLANGGDHPW
ncbi:hypothetical protein AJ78_08903 [Emergomyces pasteurianus Ep9510]|uniref:Phospholipase D n=1 Tax=Emergomyces pasteurianus Ep9510 TaxID=1447872 RepID=A0A1J9P0F8_9EURO|nr:hypothetical protein AJ78_08903 [Emergomyces pasteurianus Ep9510]